MGSEFLRVPDGWTVKPLIDCTEDGVISYGIVQPGSHDEDGIPVLRVNNFAGNSLDTTSVLKVSPEIEKKFARTRLKGGEVLLTLVGSTGQSVVAPAFLSGWNVPRAIAVIRPKHDVGSEWVNICLQTEATKSFLDSRANTTVQKTLNLQDVKQIPILIPPLDVKTRIENFAVTLNQKIALNRQINTTLESMAQALFKSWFVDFDPVIDNALAAGHDIPEPLLQRAQARAAHCALHGIEGGPDRESEGDSNAEPRTHPQGPTLPAGLQQLFPDRFVFTEEMGWVPEGWEVGPITYLADLNPEAWSNKNHPDSVKYVDLANAKNGRIDEVVAYSFADAPSRARRILRKNDTIFGTVRPGNRSFALIHEDGLTGSTGFAVLRPKDRAATAFVYLSVTRQEVVDLFAHLADGAAYPAIRSDVVADHAVVIPTEKVMSAFHNQAMPMLSSIGDREAMSIVLSDLRDSLLPKLLSGQITIPDAEQVLDEVL
jgi:type I restriction enzyme, S subunit